MKPSVGCKRIGSQELGLFIGWIIEGKKFFVVVGYFFHLKAKGVSYCNDRPLNKRFGKHSGYAVGLWV